MRVTRSARGPRQRTTTDDVQMKVEDALPRASAAVHGDTEIATPVRARHLYGDAMQVADQRIVVWCQVGECRDVPPRDHQDVRRSRRIDVAKRDRVLVLEHAIRPCLPR